MKTSMNETQQIEEYLLGQNTGEAVVMEARVLLDEELREKAQWQQRTYSLVQQYGRQKLKQEIAGIHQQLFTKAEHIPFREKVMRLFGSR